MKDQEYEEAHRSAIYFARTDRVLRRVRGRSPSQMLNGIFSGSMPRALGAVDAIGSRAGRAPWSAILSPKGKLISDVRVSRLEDGEAGALLLDLPAAGATAALDHLSRYLPPRFAKVEDLSEPAGVLTIVGPDSPRVLFSASSPLGETPIDLSRTNEGDELVVNDGSETGLRVIRTARAVPPIFDVIASAPVLARLEEAWASQGISKSTEELGEVLRVERGQPAFGIDMDAETIPMEAGVEARYIDHGKGCYTGQEVIVRIRDRGHVNRLIRGLLLGGAPIPSGGTPLFSSDEERVVGQVRSAVWSPGFGQGIALGFVRREIEPPAILALGGRGGPTVGVRELTPQGWRLVPGDPSFHPSPPAHPSL